MKHYSMQTNLTLGDHSNRLKRGRYGRNLDKSKNPGLQHCTDEMAEWALKAEPMLAFMTMIQGQS